MYELLRPKVWSQMLRKIQEFKKAISLEFSALRKENPTIRSSTRLKKVAVDICPSNFELCNNKIVRKFAASIIITNLV